MNKVFFSSKSVEWATPQDFFDKLDKEFHFDLDPCADPHNAKCVNYFTKEQDGLQQDWGGHSVFVNPPYSRKIGQWVAKGYVESQKRGTIVVMLIPARTDTSWFHDYIYTNAEIRFVRGRLKFGSGDGRAPFPSMVVIFKGDKSL